MMPKQGVTVMSRKTHKSVRDTILEYLQEFDARNDASLREIADATGLSYDSVRQCVRRMVRHGEIEVSSEERYCRSASMLERDKKQLADPENGTLLHQCLRQLENERRDPRIVAMAGLQETLNYMVSRRGTGWARERIKEFNANLEATLKTLGDLPRSEDDVNNEQSISVTGPLHPSSIAMQKLSPDEFPIIVYGYCLWPIPEGQNGNYNFNELVVACWYACAANVLEWEWSPAAKANWLSEMHKEKELKGFANAVSAFFSAYEDNPKGECEFPPVPPNFAIKPTAGISDMTVLASFIRSRKYWPIAMSQ